MQGFKAPGHAQRFLAVYGPIAPHCRPRRHRWSATEYRQEMRERCKRWAAITGTKWAAEGVGEVGLSHPFTFSGPQLQYVDNACVEQCDATVERNNCASQPTSG